MSWTAPYGSRSAPVVFGNRIYINTVVGDLGHTQERLAAIDADTGKLVWERRFSLYLSDVPQHRAAWASPAVDPATGTVYVFTVAAELAAVAPDGKLLWSRSLTEDYGAVTTHGGRTTSPIVEGDLVVLNTLILAWGDLNRPGNRYFAFDKRTGHTVWISSPQSRHYDTNYSSPVVADLPQGRALVVGGTDGAFHALRLTTGERIWSLEVSKRAILNSALVRDNLAYVTHGEENMDTTEMGMVAAVDPTGTGTLGKAAFRWVTRGFLPTFASPVMDAERLYTVDNGAILGAFDLKTGRQLWTRTLGTLQKGSPVLADGKLYVGTENGKVFILRPSAAGVEVLDEDLLGEEALLGQGIRRLLAGLLDLPGHLGAALLLVVLPRREPFENLLSLRIKFGLGATIEGAKGRLLPVGSPAPGGVVAVCGLVGRARLAHAHAPSAGVLGVLQPG